MRLGFHYHIPMYRGDRGCLRTPGYQGIFLDALADVCDEVVCFLHSPLPEEIRHTDYTLHSTNVTWIDIGPHNSVPKRMLHSRAVARSVRGWQSRLDALLIRGPSPLLSTVARAAGNLPVVLLLVGDYVAGADASSQAAWRKAADRVWSRWNQFEQLKVARSSMTLVNSRLLYEQLKPKIPELHETHTTTLSSADFFERDDTCTTRPIRLLYTGRLDRAKGVLLMIEALAWLVDHGEDVVLDLVGWAEKGNSILDEMYASANARGIGDRVVYQGYKPLGPELFDCYRKADVYMIASTSSFEGFPRTIWEALANSLPVVATTVGSIPLYLQNGVTAMLVEPRDGRLLAQAISRLIGNPTLRQALIRNGRNLARENTSDMQVGLMVQRINKWVAK